MRGMFSALYPLETKPHFPCNIELSGSQAATPVTPFISIPCPLRNACCFWNLIFTLPFFMCMKLSEKRQRMNLLLEITFQHLFQSENVSQIKPRPNPVSQIWVLSDFDLSFKTECYIHFKILSHKTALLVQFFYL